MNSYAATCFGLLLATTADHFGLQITLLLIIETRILLLDYSAYIL